MKKYKVGYTQGVYDMFHIGHLNLLIQAKKHCDVLIVGVNDDKLVEEYKNKKTIIPENERCVIVQNIKVVDDCIVVNTLDKLEIASRINYDVIFIGDDWKGTPRWVEDEKTLAKMGIDVKYLKYTKEISSTMIRTKLLEERGHNGKK